MAKRKSIKKSNILFTPYPNYYNWGGDFKAAMGGTGAFDLKSTFSGGNVAGMLKGGLAGGIGSAVGSIAGGAISGGLESGAGNAISNIGGTIGSALSTVNPVLGGIVSAGSGIIGGVTNKMFGSKLNAEKIAEIEKSNNAMNTIMVDSDNADSVMDQWTNQDFGSNFSKSDIGKDGIFSSKAASKYRQLKKQQEAARNRALLAYEDAIDAVDTQSDLNAIANFSAYGGPLDSLVADINNRSKADFVQRLLNPNRTFIKDWESDNIATHKLGWATDDKGAIVFPNVQRINGKLYDFTDPKNKRGEWDALDSAIQRGDTLRMSPSQAKEFTENYKKYYPKGASFKAFGGDLLTHGAEWDNGITVIGNGGTHEQNPFEGVQMGVDAQGIPNMVEEGEVVWNDYVFSNRLKPTKEFKDKYKVKGETFADVAKEMQKESEERPNDPISKRGLEDSMMKLQIEQEDIRMKDNRRGNKNLFWGGGPKAPELPSLKWLQQSVDKWMLDRSKRGIKGVTPRHLQIPEPGFNLSDLRYAPAVGSAIGAATSLLSKPDYSPSDTVLEAANQMGNYTPISYNPIGNYLSYNPFDRNYYTNKLNAQAGATRRAIMNTSNPSRNAALLAADYNAQGKLGDLARQAEEYNLAQRQAVEQFNRGTNQANAEMGLRAAMANQEAALKARSSRLSGITQAMQMRDAIDNRRSASISSNLTNLFNNLGNIGIDAMNRADRDFYIKHVMGANLPLEEYRRLYGLDAAKNEAKKRGFTDTEITKLFSFKNGGKLKKRRGGLTY